MRKRERKKKKEGKQIHWIVNNIITRTRTVQIEREFNCFFLIFLFMRIIFYWMIGSNETVEE